VNIKYNRGRKEIQLMDRDFEIFALIEAEGPKRSAELSQRFWKDSSNRGHAGFKRVRKLIAAGLLKRGDPSLLYLSEAARALVSDQKNNPRVQEVDQNEQSVS